MLQRILPFLFFFWLSDFSLIAKDTEPFSSLMSKYSESESVQTRNKAAENIILNFPDKLNIFVKTAEKLRNSLEKKYIEKLSSYVQEDYLQKLNALSDEDIRFIVKLKILWQPYLIYRGNRIEFKERYIKPLNKVKSLLLSEVRTIQDTELKNQRTALLAAGEIIEACRRSLNISPDPTIKIKTPTGIPYTALDTPQSYSDYLGLLEKTIILVNSVAPPEAEEILMQNVENAKIIDVYEANFTYFANEVRMLMGTVGWLADPLLSNCARDHSHDRKNGKASGHSSTIAGKHSFVDRARRMGTSARSEGAGGGKTGEAAIMGLSYGGGHTGPLYSTIRNVVGVGVREGACTAMYRGEQKLLHSAPAIDNYNFMPPGFTYKLMKSQSSLTSLYKPLQKEEFKRILLRLKNFKPVKKMDSVYSKWFEIYAELKVKDQVKEVKELIKAGDIFLAKEKYDSVRKRFSGHPLFEEESMGLYEEFGSNKNRNEYRSGRLFHKYLSSQKLSEKKLEKFIKSNNESLYSEAAKLIIENIKKPARGFKKYRFFLNKNKALYDYAYPEKLAQ